MPLTAKGEEILKSMEKTYGSEGKAEQVLFASKNAGKITGIDSSKLDRVADAIVNIHDRMDKLQARKDAASK